MNTAVAAIRGNDNEAEYHEYIARIQARFLANVSASPLFQTDADGLFVDYLGGFGDQALRQHHNCHACRQFIERFGGLVVVDEAGMTAPVVWNVDDAPEEYRKAIAAMAKAVRKAKITHPFLSSDKTWGTPVTGVWHHFAVTPPKTLVFKAPILTAGQAMAEKREDFGAVMRALSEFTQPMVEQALVLLRSDALYRSEKVLGQAEWLHGLHAARAVALGNGKANVVWRAIATAPAGFCHPRSSMIGTLLEDIAAGLDFAEVSRKFKAKMHPLAYQRPQAAPSSGAIAAAEKIMAQLGAAGALARRFARLDEVQALWRPVAKKQDAAGGVFGHLKAKADALPQMNAPAQVMTWDKSAGPFCRLPSESRSARRCAVGTLLL